MIKKKQNRTFCDFISGHRNRERQRERVRKKWKEGMNSLNSTTTATIELTS